jgi:hypothetical protein
LAGSLERLTLMMPEYDTESELDLSSFESLRYLEVDQGFMSCNQGQAHMHNNLPTNLQQIVIRRTTKWIKPSLESLFDTFVPTPKFRGLSALKLYTLKIGYDELEKELNGFKMRAQQNRINFEWEGEPEHNRPWLHEEWDVDSEAGSDSE